MFLWSFVLINSIQLPISKMNMSKFSLVLGTNNQKKRRELELLLREHPIELKTLSEFENSIEVEETGTTFRANAILKAVEQAKNLGQWVLGEDSGISVNALDGAPGVYSARFSGANATDESNNRLLLKKLTGVKPADRTAWYTCYMALSDPEGNVRAEAEGCCYGRILEMPHGSGGFGYDPLFEIPEYHLTFGQLGDTVKAVLSHRARASRRFIPQLLGLLNVAMSDQAN